MLLTLKKGITYGPVNSRRLGRSLGINLMPGTVKVCSFDCVYCQYGWTKVQEFGPGYAGPVPGADDAARAVETALIGLPHPPAYITFSGNGEPSLHPDFAEIVEAVTHVRDRLAPAAKTAILSNSSTVGDDRTRRSLTMLDVRIMKLDCGTQTTFARYSRPAPGLTLEAVTSGLADLSRLTPVTIQSLWAGGAGGNYSISEVDAWIDRLKFISPVFVQVYSLDRDTPAKDLAQLSRDKLATIQRRAQNAGIPAAMF